MKVFEPNIDADECILSAVVLIDLLLANRNSKILEKHLKILIGKITEAHGKRNTRYWSNEALQCSDQKQLRHEHVYTRKRMIQALLVAGPKQSREILKDAIGCTVTAKEHTE